MHDAPHGPDSKTAPNQVLGTAATWPGVTTRSTPRGAIALHVDEHEIGHVHLDRATPDLPLGSRKAEVLRQGRAKDWADDWVTKALKTDADAEDGSDSCALATTSSMRAKSASRYDRRGR